MVLVAAVALGSSTYAWFAQNTTVKAESMTVTATTSDPYLQISSDDGSTWKTEILDLAVTEDNLKLVSPKTIGYNSSTWFEAKSDDPAMAVTTYSESTKSDVTDKDTAYMAYQALKLKNASATTAANNLTVSATVTGAGTTLDKSLRVLVIDENGKYAVFNSEGTLVTSGVYSASAAQLEATLATETELGVEVYVYFDGVDENATTNQAKNLGTCAVSLQFTVVKP